MIKKSQNIDLNKVISFCKKDKTILAAYLFGSYAKNKSKPTSDLDLALLTSDARGKRKKFEKRMRFNGELSRLLKKEVDLIFLEESSDLLGYEIIKTGKLIYEANKAKHRYLAAKIVLKYLDFQYIQKIMEQGMIRSIKRGR